MFNADLSVTRNAKKSGSGAEFEINTPAGWMPASAEVDDQGFTIRITNGRHQEIAGHYKERFGAEKFRALLREAFSELSRKSLV